MSAQLKLLTDYDKARLVIAKIKPMFGESPECKLFFAVVSMAIKDVYRGKWCESHDVHKAREYLKGDLECAEMCGCNAEYIRRIIREVGLNLEDDGMANRT